MDNGAILDFSLSLGGRSAFSEWSCGERGDALD